MNQKLRAVIAVAVAVFLFLMGFEFGKVFEKRSAEKDTKDVGATVLPTEEAAPSESKPAEPDTTTAPAEKATAPTEVTLPSLTQPKDASEIPTGLDDITTFPLEDAWTTYPEQETAPAQTAAPSETQSPSDTEPTGSDEAVVPSTKAP